MNGRENMRCHFVPQSYIKRFKDTHDGSHLYTLKVTPGADCKVITKSPENVAQIYNWYISKDLQNRYEIDSDQIENDYCSLFESELPSALNDLEAGKMNHAAKETIARFISYTLHRVPISREYYQKAPKAKKDLPASVSEDNELVKMGETILMHLGTVLSGEDLYQYLMSSEWWLVRNKGVLPFISSDNPVIMKSHPGTSLKNPLSPGKVSEIRARQTGYCISVSPKYVLYINTGLVKEKEDVFVMSGAWDDERTKIYNDIVLKQSLSTIYSNSKNLLEKYQIEINAGIITNNEFIDDPWKEESNSR